MTETHMGTPPYGIEHEPDWVPTLWLADGRAFGWRCRICGVTVQGGTTQVWPGM